MIKTALKHWIYDYCINVAFDNIQNNFMVNNNKNKVLELGNYYKTLGFTVTNVGCDYIEFLHCNITDLLHDTVGFWCTNVEEYKDGKHMFSSDGKQMFFRMYQKYLVKVVP